MASRSGAIISREAKIISRRKHDKPAMSKSMEVIKVSDTKSGILSPILTSIKSEAIDVQTHNAAKVISPIERRIQAVLRAIMSNSGKYFLRFSMLRPFKKRARSTERPSRLTNTERMEPMPVNKKPALPHHE